MKSVFITGAGRGLGKGITEYFLQNKFRVFAGVRFPENLDQDFKSNRNLIPVSIDVTNDKSIQKAAEYVAGQTDSLDYLINNAGTNKDTATGGHKELVCNLKSLDRKLLLKMFDVNSVSPLMVVKYFIDLLKSDPSYIVNISSARSSFRDENPNTSANYGYRASKAALNLITWSSLFDLPANVRTYAVHPGSVRTDMNPSGVDDPLVQAGKIIGISRNWKKEYQGNFLRYDGTLYPLR